MQYAWAWLRLTHLQNTTVLIQRSWIFRGVWGEALGVSVLRVTKPKKEEKGKERGKKRERKGEKKDKSS